MEIPPPPGPQQPQGQPQGPYGEGPYGSYQGQGPYPPQGPYAPQGPGPGPYGYQPWGQGQGQGYPPYNGNGPAPVNGLAIAALVLGILCFLPLVGLVLGFFALGQIRKKGERGKGMAIAGMILSGIGAAILALALATGGAADFWEGFKEGAREAGGNGATFSVDEGECFDAPGGSLEGMAYDVDTVSCEGEHDGEVFANFTMAGGGYPGDEAIAEAADKCYTLQYAYAMDSWAIPENVDIYYFTPTRDSWSLGDREISCLFGNVDEKGSLTGSLRQDGTTLDADQLAYLKAAQVLNEAMEAAPDEEYVEDDLPGHKEWATKVSGAITEQIGMLRGHDWPTEAKEPVAALVKDLDKARGEWAEAAKAADADAFYEHYGKALELTDAKKAVTTRKALGLASAPPESYEGDESDGGGEGGGDEGTGTGGGTGGGGAEV
ncbi:DUF4190 domain-containing protein [Streptomyces sp. NBC_00878]|uniref:DUF4190 domain-containing protein n=1 Tax=Streptomyces sp. NBC_00878 TaxID=2975854 RepID=UPI00224FAF09|nr:DUF4190 domain-containing protein [Streptomyces sp. NBC_00878]MCX4905708.1 DUF4190 domain-containing protein [Streptomyces sp. NBC_00878]